MSNVSSVFYQVPKLTHKQEVTRLYRHSLKHLLSWIVRRDLWRQEALELRDRFDANKDIKDMKKAKRLLEEGQAEFKRHMHPNPYISPRAPGGTMWERDVPFTPEALEMLPIEQEWYDEACKHGKK